MKESWIPVHLGLDAVDPLHGIDDEAQLDLVELGNDHLALVEVHRGFDVQKNAQVNHRKDLAPDGGNPDQGPGGIGDDPASRPMQDLPRLVDVDRKGLLSQEENPTQIGRASCRERV